MTTQPNDRVYPCLEFDGGGDAPLRPYTYEWGLTKRELFAAMAMQGAMGDSSRDGRTEGYAADAVRAADALIAELNKGDDK